MSDELSKEEKAIRVGHLKALVETEGWKILQEELDNDIALTEEKLHGETPLGKRTDGLVETIPELQRERMDRIELRDLPKNLIEEYEQKEPEQEDFTI